MGRGVVLSGPELVRPDGPILTVMSHDINPMSIVVAPHSVVGRYAALFGRAACWVIYEIRITAGY